MMMTAHNLKLFVAALCAVFFVQAAAAQQTADSLLEELRTAPEAEAARIDRELSMLWSRSGSAAMDLLLKRGREALEEEQTREAIEHLTALTDHAPEFAEGWHLRATAYFRAGLYGPALDDLERALALNPENYNAIFGLGVIFKEFGDFELAGEAFQRVLDLNPHHENAMQAMRALRREGIGRTL